MIDNDLENPQFENIEPIFESRIILDFLSGKQLDEVDKKIIYALDFEKLVNSGGKN